MTQKARIPASEDNGKIDSKIVNDLLNTLPGDITFIDENDIIRYYNLPRERLFTRGPEINGTTVQSCHSPESLPHIDQMLDKFKSGASEVVISSAEVNGKTVHIEYLAVRDSGGKYLGCLEFAAVKQKQTLMDIVKSFLKRSR